MTNDLKEPWRNEKKLDIFNTMDALKIATAGSVDDGKSTLIGRLLYETKSLKLDQLELLTKKSQQKGYDYIDFSLATDGLLTERAQGITIDVSHLYLTTPKRRYVLADAPGHQEYTRNMVTAASNAQAAVVLLDARKGVVEQTKRHFYITQLLGLNHLIFAINKMDLVDFNQEVYQKIADEIQLLVNSELRSVVQYHIIPISALHGANITHHSPNTPWYDGPSFMEALSRIPSEIKAPSELNVLQVQWVIRPKTEAHHDYRGFAGKVQSGIFKKGMPITIFPSKLKTTVLKIERYGQEVDSVQQGENASLILADQVNVDRGSTLISDTLGTVRCEQSWKARICWLQNTPLNTQSVYLLQHGPQVVKCKILHIRSKTNIETGVEEQTNSIELNDIGIIEFMTDQPITATDFKTHRHLGSWILIDPQTNNTAAVGMNQSEI